MTELSCILSSRIPPEYTRALQRIFPDIDLIFFPQQGEVYASISAHPDIFLCQIGPQTIVYAPSIPQALIKSLKVREIELISSGEFPKKSYPQTAILNGVCVGKYFLHDRSITDPMLLKQVQTAGLVIIDCPQGYTRCSIVPVGEEALITSDSGIARATRTAGLDVLEIRPGHIVLPGEEYGFLGGAGGVLPEGRVVFLGDIRQHPDFQAIAAFFHTHLTDYLFLPELPLFDAGALIFI